MNDNVVASNAIVDVDFIAAHLDDPGVRIVEVDVSPAGYRAGHIPGAILWDAYGDLRHPDFSSISDDELRDLVRRSGIAADTTVVACGYGAHLGYWLLKSCGHDRVKLMDGSRERWLEAGQVWSTDVPRPTPSSYQLGPQERFIASRADVLAMVQAQRGVIVDVRSGAEYSGVNFWPSGAPQATGRAGHIPGAIHVPVEVLRTSDATFVETETIERVLRDHKIDPTAEIVTYCTIGNRASQVWYAMTALLGYSKVRVYYGSWVEWGLDPESTVEV
jgi:thiosulfate/3-mercaptopyruvate sulfurtransferase